LLDSRGEGLARVGGFSGGEADEFSTCKGKGGGDEDRAEAFEAIVEGAGVAPVAAADEGSVDSSTDIENDAENDETNDGNDFDNGEDKFCLSISLNTKEIDAYDEHQKDSNPGSRRDG